MKLIVCQFGRLPDYEKMANVNFIKRKIKGLSYSNCQRKIKEEFEDYYCIKTLKNGWKKFNKIYIATLLPVREVKDDFRKLALCRPSQHKN